jgi:subtilisin family serine protease
MTRLASLGVAAVAFVLALGGPTAPANTSARTDVVVLLDSPPLARAPAAAARIAFEQRAFRRELSHAVPSARVGWRYRIVANGYSVSVPAGRLATLRTLAGVRDVLPTATYVPRETAGPEQIGAPAIWGDTLGSAGQGVKIGIIDSGIDPSHPYFDPAGYAMPAGFPKGQERFTTAKVIVARSFPPKSGASGPSVRLAYSSGDSTHGTHVAGIAAGNADTATGQGRISGVAPRAYLGNYKVFVQTDSGLSPNANSAAIVAAIESAVADGMDVVNFSGGEPEIDPRRDVVALALDAAAAAGVVPVIAAGNDYNDLGAGSVSSPANAQDAISVAAVGSDGSSARLTHADFSSVGPTAISLRLKPDVAAPGVDTLSSLSGGGWGELSGTSMATPHVAGAAALLRQRHPAWTVAQLKSALVQTGVDSLDDSGRLAGPRFQGGGVVALQRADRPLLFADPTAISFALMGRGLELSRTVGLDDAGGGSGTWSVASVVRGIGRGVRLTVPQTVTVPGELNVSVLVGAGAAAADLDAYIELRRGSDVRRVPLWGRVTVAALSRHTTVPLTRPGAYKGTTRNQDAFVTRYRYPETPSGVGVTTTLNGPERVFRIHLTKRVANFGVVVTGRGKGSRVEPRVVSGLDENRLTGYAGLPLNSNPYLEQYDEPAPAAGVLSPVPGDYAVVFDSGSRAGAGAFSFRYWVNDVTPPTLRLRSRSVRRGQELSVSAVDKGAGVYPDTIMASVDGNVVRARYHSGVISIPTRSLTAGTHRLRLRVSDYQEAKNTENVARILPNTRTLTVAFRATS